MPKETFYRLSKEKREKVEKALENEFGRTSFEKASISKIVEEANIPRGSFYQYFEDKEDAIRYVMNKYILLEKEVMKNILRETKGNIFEASLQIFDYMTYRTQRNLKVTLYKNIMQELKKDNINVFNDKEENKEINQLIDITILNISEEKELKHIMRIITAVTRTANIQVNSGNMTIQEARDELEKQIKILKKGMEK